MAEPTTRRAAELSLYSRIILSILDNNIAERRDIFGQMVLEWPPGKNIDLPNYIVAAELCQALSDDPAPLPVNLCNTLLVPPGTTYARGADRLKNLLRGMI